MQNLIALLLKYLPSQIEAIKLLQYVPDAVATVKELIAFTNRTIATLKTEKLTPEQLQELDELIESFEDMKHWQPDPE